MRLFKILSDFTKQFGFVMSCQTNDEGITVIQLTPHHHNQKALPTLTIRGTAEELDEHLEETLEKELQKASKTFKLDGSLEMKETAKVAPQAKKAPAKKATAHKPKTTPTKTLADIKPKKQEVSDTDFLTDDDW